MSSILYSVTNGTSADMKSVTDFDNEVAFVKYDKYRIAKFCAIASSQRISTLFGCLSSSSISSTLALCLYVTCPTPISPFRVKRTASLLHAMPSDSPMLWKSVHTVLNSFDDILMVARYSVSGITNRSESMSISLSSKLSVRSSFSSLKISESVSESSSWRIVIESFGFEHFSTLFNAEKLMPRVCCASHLKLLNEVADRYRLTKDTCDESMACTRMPS
mmetsp:Transcript_75273/g.119672  ORF Transcript_75273/g.119672 Transcript_75273/m.119672 type:complete len:219 (-) Transcript_75273:200-856(-)